MTLRAVVISMLVLSAMAATATASTNVTACGQSLNVAGEYYIFNTSINATATCLTVGANNITIDGAGYQLWYARTGVGHGIIDSGGYDNITIANLSFLKNSTYANSYTVTGSGMSNSIIINNTFNITSGNTNRGIYLYTLSTNNTISGNNITTEGWNSNGIVIATSSSNNTIVNNTIHVGVGNGAGGFGIWADSGAHFFNISNNVFVNMTETSVLFNNAGNYSSVINNTIEQNNATQGRGIEIINSSYSNYFFNQIHTAATSFTFGTNSNYNNITDNTILQDGSTFTAFYIGSGSGNNTVINLTVSAPVGGWAFEISGATTKNNTIRDSSFTGSGYDYAISSAVDDSNRLIRTNFTGQRTLNYEVGGLSYFNYSNDSTVFVSTNISIASILSRSIRNWNQSNITLRDNASGSVLAYYKLSGLLPSRYYNIFNNSVINSTVTTDSAGQLPTFSAWQTTTLRTLSIEIDTLPPVSITSLICVPNTDTPNTAIDCSWTNPPDADYDHIEKYINQVFQQNTSTPVQAVTIGGLHPDRQYTVSTYTVDVAGNVNSTWVNTTVRTQVADCSDTDRDTNLAFQLLGVLLIVGSMGFLVASAWSGQVRGIIIGASGVMVGGIMLTIGYFVVVTVSNGMC